MHLVDIEYFYCTDCEWKDNCENVKCDVKDMPIVDAVVVVRCKDCVQAGIKSDNNKYIICCRLGVSMEFDDFCSYGVRKDGDDNNAAD